MPTYPIFSTPFRRFSSPMSSISSPLPSANPSNTPPTVVGPSNNPFADAPDTWEDERGPLPKPREFQEYYDDPEGGIVIWTGSDHLHELRKKIKLEHAWAAIKNTPFENDENTKRDFSHQIYVVMLPKFFTNGESCSFYVQGVKNISKLMVGTFTKRAYEGAAFITTITTFTPNELFDITVPYQAFEIVDRKETKGIRWRYLFNSAVEIYKNIEFDKEIYNQLRDEVEREEEYQEIMAQTESETEEGSEHHGLDEENEGPERHAVNEEDMTLGGLMDDVIVIPRTPETEHDELQRDDDNKENKGSLSEEVPGNMEDDDYIRNSPVEFLYIHWRRRRYGR
ncbi:hypothetical protein P154DRAFT_564998 [Amniculicola lignicola CBS 123094]|uniref:Uncharacterized protein n=1 Tax=Amniculicola lignicola CBS 123094 TaxID=1392246 RepID=A0A6A5WB82_9PLEO|nr:hypothetical protein P154DRAFT_564998 [Amniculicola lignicola CBS 123094]